MNQPDVVSHEILNVNRKFAHRLVVNGVVGSETSYERIAENGKYRALIQDYWGTEYPAVYVMEAVTHIAAELSEKEWYSK
jgi:hypothetical protein